MVVPESPVLYNNKAGNTNSMMSLVTVHGNKAGVFLSAETKLNVLHLASELVYVASLYSSKTAIEDRELAQVL